MVHTRGVPSKAMPLNVSLHASAKANIDTSPAARGALTQTSTATRVVGWAVGSGEGIGEVIGVG